jgi:hypothetical protein
MYRGVSHDNHMPLHPILLSHYTILPTLLLLPPFQDPICASSPCFQHLAYSLKVKKRFAPTRPGNFAILHMFILDGDKILNWMVVGIVQIYNDLNYFDNLTLICIVVPMYWVKYWRNNHRILHDRQEVLKMAQKTGSGLFYGNIPVFISRESHTTRYLSH